MEKIFESFTNFYKKTTINEAQEFKQWALDTAGALNVGKNSTDLIKGINKIDSKYDDNFEKMMKFLDFLSDEGLVEESTVLEAQDFKQWALDTAGVLGSDINNKVLIDGIKKIESKYKDNFEKMMKFMDFLDDEGSVNEDHVVPGTKVELTDGRFVTIQNWSEEEDCYIGLVEDTGETVKVKDEEIKTELE